MSWRGCGADAPEHVLSGRITPDLLKLLGIPFWEADAERLEAQALEADREAERMRQPAAVLVTKGIL